MSCPSNIEFVIFDCDGTLVDSETLSMHVFCDHVARLGFQIGHQEALDRYAGQDLNEVLVEIGEQLERKIPDHFMKEFRTDQIARLKTDLVAIDGIGELLENITAPFCVASNAPRYKVETCLESTSLDRFFTAESIFSAYDIDRWKPAPDLFELAAKRCDTEPKHCAVVEDSIFGIKAGLAAGMQVFAFDPHDRLECKPDGVTFVASMKELHQYLPTSRDFHVGKGDVLG